MIPSTKKQRQIIAIGCSQLGIDAETRHEMLMYRFGVDSSTKLTKSQAKLFLMELVRKGFRIIGDSLRPRFAKRSNNAERLKNPAPRPHSGNIVRLATREQHEKIAALAGLINWQYADGLERWMQKRLGIEKVRTAWDAWLVIEGLKKMFENHMKKKYGPSWKGLEYSDPAVEMYIREHGPATNRRR